MTTRPLSLAALLSAALSAVPGTARATALRLLEDDFDAARVESQTRKVPLFIEVWAPW